MTFNWPMLVYEGDLHPASCILFCDDDAIPLLSRPRYLWFLKALPEAERARKMEAARSTR